MIRVESEEDIRGMFGEVPLLKREGLTDRLHREKERIISCTRRRVYEFIDPSFEGGRKDVKSRIDRAVSRILSSSVLNPDNLPSMDETGRWNIWLTSYNFKHESVSSWHFPYFSIKRTRPLPGLLLSKKIPHLLEYAPPRIDDLPDTWARINYKDESIGLLYIPPHWSTYGWSINLAHRTRKDDIRKAIGIIRDVINQFVLDEIVKDNVEEMLREMLWLRYENMRRVIRIVKEGNEHEYHKNQEDRTAQAPQEPNVRSHRSGGERGMELQEPLQGEQPS